MTDIGKHPLLGRVYELCTAIEACAASDEQTKASELVSSLLTDLGEYYEKYGPISMSMCTLDMSHCDHEFTQTGDPDKDYCEKCGQSVWAWAFMECP